MAHAALARLSKRQQRVMVRMQGVPNGLALREVLAERLAVGPETSRDVPRKPNEPSVTRRTSSACSLPGRSPKSRAIDS
jgi:hypothetical protein